MTYPASPHAPLGKGLAKMREAVHDHTRTGVIKGIREAYDKPDLVEIELEHPAEKRKRKGDGDLPAFIPTSQHQIPKSKAKGLTIGDRVRVRTMIEKDTDADGE